jgi:UDP-GlcNAc3NAcA epimerase
MTGFENLVREGFSADTQPPYSSDHPKIYHCGDVMFDNALYFYQKAEKFSDVYDRTGLEEGKFILCTIHRDNNTDDPARLNSLFRSLQAISLESGLSVVLPLHPRTRKMLAVHLEKDLMHEVGTNKRFIMTEPLSYLEMLLLERRSLMILTDSGGVQKESYFFKKPCIVLRSESEWKELLDAGTALLADADEERILRAFRQFINHLPTRFPPIFGDGKASDFICQEMIRACSF